ncbi:hypothetical protein PE36_20130 [Moritella sp. PE36]|uniref:type VI secretion system baseplate subunit TssG n=1 Tax=Moritella sp. PE36 TaxID=58051 RepID=UPI00015687E2|nr:type VI secretion system baseplate subunit TssG [Moritella sp. PE36]EDM68949.1 hypothetical protein PE36_20130 [Moritella sp. PE36]
MQKSILGSLRCAPYKFELPQAVQLVKHHAAKLGARPELDFITHLLPSYHQSDIVEVQQYTDNSWHFTCDLPALSGSQGVMPRYNYSEALRESFEQGNSALVDFLDGFNNRYFRLYCQTETKNNIVIQAEEERFSWNRHHKSLTTMLSSLAGDTSINTALPQGHLIQYSGLMGSKVTCLTTLKHLLADYFGYEFEVDHGDIEYQPLLGCCLTHLGATGQNNQLGFDALLGKSAVTAFQQLDVKVKPNHQNFEQLNKNKVLSDAIDAFIRHYMGSNIKINLAMKVAGQQLPACQLTRDASYGVRLSQSARLASTEITQQYVVMPLKLK